MKNKPARRAPNLSDIASSTKICLRYLEAIEKGDFAKLPGGVYGRSYIRQYAAAAGRNADDLLHAYQRARGESTS
jgi:cytoskeletal protein RodZ